MRNALILLSMLPLGLALSASLACSGDKPIGEDGTAGDGGGDDGGTTGPECVEDGECADYEICDVEECVDGDRNNSVDEAETVLWDDEVSGYVNPAGDVDYFKLVADGGEFVRIRTIHEYDEGDTAVTLRDSSGKIVTSSDNYPTGGSTSSADSTIYAYLSSAGDYFIEVEDVGTYYENGEEVGDNDYEYRVTVETWGQHTSESDGIDDPSLELAFEGTNSYSAVGVVLEEDDDVDVITISHAISDTNLWIYGILDLAGSEADPSVRVWSDGEEVLIDKQGVGEGGYAYTPTTLSGTFTLELYDSDMGGSDEHWFFIFPILFERGDSYPEETEINDELSFANAMEMTESTTSGGSDYAFGQATGYVDAIGDEDWFRVPARTDAELVVCLSSARGGSLVMPDIEVYDSTGTLVDSGAGNAAVVPNASVEGVTMGSGDYYLRIVDPEGVYSGPGAWYRLVVYTADFDVSTYSEGGYSCPA